MAIDQEVGVVSERQDAPPVAAGAESTDVFPEQQPNVEDGVVEAESNDVVPERSNVEDVDSSPNVAVVEPGAVAATSTRPKQRQSSPLDIVVASGHAPHFKDQVADASPTQENVDVENSPRNIPERTATPNIRIQKEQFYSSVNIENENNVEETRTNSTSQLQHHEHQLDPEDQSRAVLLQANTVAETDEERRRRVLGEAVGTAEVLDVSDNQLFSRKRALWCGVFLVILAIIGVVAGITASSSQKANDTKDATSLITPTEAPLSLNYPTAAPTVREPAEVVLQLAIGNEIRNGEILMDLYDGALVDVDEVGTDLFAIIANASPNVRSVLFDNGVVEKDRPFSRCESTRAFGLLGCVDMRGRGF